MDFVTFFLVNLLIAALTPAPKLPKPKVYSLNEFSIPTAEEGRALPYIAGQVPVAGNVTWFGDYTYRAATRRVRVSVFKKATQTLGYQYYIGMALSLCAMPVDALRQVLWGDRIAWSGNVGLSKTATTDVRVSLYYSSQEGQEVPDGLDATFRFYNQAVDELPSVPAALTNPYLAARVGRSSVPVYPNTCHAMMLGPSSGTGGGGFVGSSPQIPPLQFVLYRLPAVKFTMGVATEGYFDLRNVTYPVAGSVRANASAIAAFIDSKADVDGDANPAFVLWELLTTRVSGLGLRLSPYALSYEAFMRAADKLHAEKMGVSFAWETSKPVGQILADILKQINGTLDIDPRTGQVTLKLIRETDVPVATFNSDNIVEWGFFKRTAPVEAINQVVLKFSDRDLRYEQRSVTAQNLALISQTTSLNSREIEYLGVSNARLASVLVSRELRAASSPLATARFSAVLPVDQVLQPGDLVMVYHEELDQLLRMRVTGARWADYGNRNRVELEVLEDVFRNGDESLAVVTPVEPPAVVDPLPVSLASPVLTYAPFALVGEDYDHAIYYAEAQDTATLRYRLAIQELSNWSSSTEPEYVQEDDIPAISGTLSATLASTTSLPTVALTLTETAAARWTAARVQGELLLVAGSEWLACSSFSLAGTTLTLTNVKRGVFDTWPRRHAAGTKFTLLTGFTVDDTRLQTNLNTNGGVAPGLTVLTVRADSIGNAGTLFAESNASSQATLGAISSGTSRAVAPLTPANVRASSVVGVTSLEDTAPALARTSSLSLAWTNRNRTNVAVEDWFSATAGSESGQLTRYEVAYENSDGSGTFTVSQGFTDTAVGASTASSPLTSVPAGARRIRVRVQSTRPNGTGNATSQTSEHYWRLTS